MRPTAQPAGYRFGAFELDLEETQLRANGTPVRLSPQPFRLLVLLVSRADHVVTREEIRAALWDAGTFVDFDQGVNFSIRQIREALGDAAERPRYVQTVPRRGYRFLGPVEPLTARPDAPRLVAGTDAGLHKVLWANIAELRMAEVRRKRLLRVALIALFTCVALALVGAALFLL